MQKTFRTSLVFLLVLAMLAVNCFAFAGTTDGTYETVGQGNNGPVTVATTITNGVITSVELVSHSETSGLGDVAAAEMVERIVAANSVNVDTVSGATNSSNAVIEAVSKAIEAADGNVNDFLAVDAEEETYEDLHTDVLIIGAGGSGLAAANAAKRGGKDVIVIEKNGTIGGATAVSGGGFIGGVSKLQKELGVDNDSYDLIYNDLLAGGIDNDPTLLRMYAENCGITVDWMYYDLELPVNQTLSHNIEHTVDRAFSMEGGASGITAELKKAYDKVDGKLLLETKATALLQDDNGTVIGATVVKAGNEFDIYAESVILATGGFGANRDLLPSSVDNVLYYGPATSTGDGLYMAVDVGATTWYMDHVKVYPHGIALGDGRAAVGTGGAMNATAQGGAIYVDPHGNRVVNENAAFTEIRDVTLEQDGEILWLLLDAPTFEIWKSSTTSYKFMTEEQIDAAVEANGNSVTVFLHADTIADVASLAGIDSDVLVKTVEDWNAAVDAGADEAFGNPILNKIGEGPYYLIKQNTRFASTLGGLKVDTEMHVLDDNDNPIEGLFAAGEIIGGAHGKDSMPCCNVAWALTTGRIAGEVVAAK